MWYPCTTYHVEIIALLKNHKGESLKLFSVLKIGPDLNPCTKLKIDKLIFLFLSGNSTTLFQFLFGSFFSWGRPNVYHSTDTTVEKDTNTLSHCDRVPSFKFATS